MTMFFISFRLLSFLCLIVIVTAQRHLEYSPCVNNTGFYTTNSTYKTNLSTLLSNLTSNAQIDYGFYNISYGLNSDKVSTIRLCRGDIKPGACRSCLHNATIILPQVCPFNKEAWGGYDECISRYSNRQILHFEDYVNSVYTWNIRNITAPWDQYVRALRQLLERVRGIAASGDSLRKFAPANAQGPELQSIYAVTQCTPDLSKQDCADCLTRATEEISFCCVNRIGARVIKPSCNLRCEKDRFYDATVETLAVTRASPPSSTEKSETSRIIITIVVSVAAFVVLVIFTFIYCRLRKKRKTIGSEAEAEAEVEVDEDIKLTESLQFGLETITAATNDFSDENKLGQGGFGAVYKAWKNWREGTATDVVDPALTNGSRNEMMRCIHIALLCVQKDVADRPNMASVMLMLNSYSLSLPIPSRPAFFMDSGSFSTSIERASNSTEASVDKGSNY